MSVTTLGICGIRSTRSGFISDEERIPAVIRRQPGKPTEDGLLFELAQTKLAFNNYLQAAQGKLMGLAGFTALLQRQGVPASDAFAILGAGIEFLGGLALVFGIATRYAALALIAFTLVATGIAHRFWEFDEATRRAQAINFNKNMSMVGGLLAMVVAGPGRFSLDRLLARRS